jgi:succinoglycan biosynthesis protein ExoA
MTNTNGSTFPKLSVILPVRNEERFIARTIRYIQDQEYPFDKLEIIVVDGESDDRTCEIVSQLAKSDARIRLLNNPKRLSSAARALGVAAATGEIVTFIDGHTYIDNSQLLKNTALLMNEKGVSVLSRPQFLETADNTFFQRAVAMARRHPLGHGLDSTIYSDQDGYVDPSSSGASYRRELFERVGNFDERFDACEDVEFNYRVARAEYKSFTSLKLAVYYYPRGTFGGLFRQLRRYGIGRFRLARKHPRTLSFGGLIPLLFVVSLLVLPIVSIFSHTALVFLGLEACLYLLGTGAAALQLAVRHGLKYFPVLPPIFWTIHWALGWGFLVELLRVSLSSRSRE